MVTKDSTISEWQKEVDELLLEASMQTIQDDSREQFGQATEKLETRRKQQLHQKHKKPARKHCLKNLFIRDPRKTLKTVFRTCNKMKRFSKKLYLFILIRMIKVEIYHICGTFFIEVCFC